MGDIERGEIEYGRFSLDWATVTVQRVDERPYRMAGAIDALLRHVQQRGVSVQEEDSVREYLQKFPDMIAVTESIIGIALRFCSARDLILSLYTDPEIDDTYLELSVRWEECDEAALEQILDASAAYLAGRRGWLQVTVDV